MPVLYKYSKIKITRSAILLRLVIIFIAGPILTFKAQAQGTPAAPTVSGNVYICSGNNVTLTAIGASGATFAWYDAATGGNLLSTGAVYTTPALTTNRSFYVQQTVSGSTSTRYAATVLVSPIPAALTNVKATPATICQGTSTNLTATVDASAGQYVYWYDAATGGNLLAGLPSGTNFSVSPTATTTYYAQSQAKIDTAIFNYTGGVQIFTVPAGVTSLQIDASGGRGGKGSDQGGGVRAGGGRVQTTMAVTPGQVLSLYVGGAGSDFQFGRTDNQPTPGGSNGGGSAPYSYNNGAGGGGGATDIRTNGQALNNRILVAGGGGGGAQAQIVAAGGYQFNGGTGGGLTGNSAPLDVAYSNQTAAGGGSQTAGGAGGCDASNCAQAGSLGQGGQGLSSGGNGGGGGGGGYYGGGGGNDLGGGGGGSSYTSSSNFQNVVHTQGYQGGNGRLVIYYNSGANCAVTTRQPVTVTVNTTPTVSAGASVITCAGTAVTLTAKGADTYVWQPGSLTGASVSVNPSVTTTYTVTGTLNNGGCSNTSNVTVTVSSVMASAPQTICAGQTATLTASGADSYTWMPGNLTGASVNVSPGTTTVYTVTGHNNSGCSTTAQTTVNVNPAPVISAGNPITVTAGTSVTLTATGNANSYQWTSPYSSAGASITFTPSATQTWTVTGTIAATGCTATSSVVVTVIPVLSVTGSTIVCPGSSTTLTASGTGPFTWYDAATGGNLLYTGAAFTTPAINSNVTYWVSDNGGTRILVNINVRSFMSKAVATPASICAGSGSLLSVTQNNQTINWYDAATGGNLLGSTAAGGTFSVSPAQTTIYYARITTPVKPDTVIFNYTGGVQTFTVPAGITSLQIDASGGRGGKGSDQGGGVRAGGGRVQATMAVTPGQVLSLYVGGAGSDFQFGRTDNQPTPGGSNGGGSAPYSYNNGAGGGGGATDIRTNGQALNNRILVAGGGGGGAQAQLFANGDYKFIGGSGGGLTGDSAPIDAAYNNQTVAGGGSQTAGGAGGCDANACTQAGSLGQGGQGLSFSGNGGGGGGGGFYGGGGGNDLGGGGGGSSYTNPTMFQNVVHTRGYQGGNGQVKIIYNGVNSCTVSMVLPDTVTVNPILTSSVKIAAGANCQACTLQTVTFTATATNGGIAPVYAWYKNNVLVGANASVYSDNALTAIDQVWCVLTSNYPCLTNVTATSNIITSAAPVITGLSPSSGSVGTLVTITGTSLTNFTSLSIGGVTALPLSNSDTQIVAMVMPGAVRGGATVTTLFGTGSGGSFTITAAGSTNTQQGNELTGTNTMQLGSSVALSADGNTAVVGVSGDNGGAGGALIYTRNNGNWARQGNELTGTGAIGSGGLSNTGQGNAVAISADGNTVVVGSSSENSNAGAVWVFTRTNGSWSQQGNKLTGSDEAGGAQFGYAVSLSANGNTAFIGGLSDNNNLGAGWIFNRVNGVWAQSGNKLVGTGAINISQVYMGNSVAISADGNTAVLGGKYDNGRTGAIWVFTNNNGIWTQQGSKLLASGAISTPYGPELGYSVAVSADGNTIFSGGSRDNNFQGAAWVFTRSGGVWTQQGNKLIGTGIENPNNGSVYFGNAVSLSADGNTAIVGATQDNNYTGAMWIFTRSNGTWTQQGNKIKGVGEVPNTGLDNFGRTMALSSDATTALVGSQYDNSSAGAVWAFIQALSFPAIAAQTYGGADFNAGANSGQAITYNSSNTAVATVVSGNIHIIAAGTSVITATSGGVSLTQTLTVNQAPLTITANNQSMVQGSAIPNLTITYGGFVNGDTPAILTAPPVAATTVTPVSPAGSYPITVSGASAANYAITYIAGNLTVTAIQAPVISYAGPQTFKVNVAIAPVSPSNSGGAIPLSGFPLVSDFAGQGNCGYFDGTGTGAYFCNAPGVAADAQGNIYVADATYNIIRKITPAGVVTTIAGTRSAGFVNGTGTAASFNNPIGITVDGQGNIYVADNNNQAIRKISPAGVVTTLAGSGTAGLADGTGTAASFSYPYGVAADGQGNIFVADLGNRRIRKITAAGVVTTFAGGGPGLANDGTGTAASFGVAYGVGTDAQGNVYVADQGANKIRKISPAGVVTTLAGSGANGATNGTGTNATFSNPVAVATDGQGNIYVAESGTNDIRKVTPAGVVTTLAGNGQTGAANGIGTAATLNYPRGVTIDVNGNIFVADDGNSKIRKIVQGPYRISPALPAGLNIDNATGVISGMPTTVSTATNYTITTYNPGGSSQATLNIAVNGLSNNALLTSIKVSPSAPLTTVSGADFRDYTATLPNSQSSVSITATVQDATAAIKINGVTTASSTPSAAIPLNVGDNVINTVVTAQDGVTTKTYSIKFTRLPSTNANLSGLTLSIGTLSPVFATGTTGYTASVSSTTASITVTPTASDATATIMINGITTPSGTSSASIPLVFGSNTITGVVTAQDGTTTKTYTVTVTRAGSNNALLTSIKVSPATTLTTVTGVDFRDYTTTVPNSESSVSITATVQDATAAIKINGATTASGTASATIPLNVGDNIINTVVTAQDGITTKTYSIKFTRLPSSNANLAGLTLSSGTLSPAFAAGTTGYTASVSNATATITVTPTASDPTATIKVNGITTSSGVASGSIPLVVGANNLTAVVTAQDGSTIKTYTVTVTRAGSNNALLTSIRVSPVTTLTTISGADFRDYTTAVPNNETSVKITATSQDATATIKVNGVTTASGIASAAIPLNVGDNVINTIVTAQDSVTIKTYSIKFTRQPPAGAALSYTDNTSLILDNSLMVHQNISPNGDGNSDVLIIDGITTYPENKVQIMNRNGVLVYEASGYDNQVKVFDGHSSINGKLQQAGTYFYSLEYKDGKETKRKTGFIVLKY